MVNTKHVVKNRVNTSLIMEILSPGEPGLTFYYRRCIINLLNFGGDFMFGWLLGIDIMGGGLTPPDDMPISDTFTIEAWHVLLVAGIIIIGILLLPKFIEYIKKTNDSIDEDEPKNDE